MLWLFPGIKDMLASTECVDQEEDPQRKQLVAPSTFAILQHVSPYVSAFLVEGLRHLKHLPMSLPIRFPIKGGLLH